MVTNYRFNRDVGHNMIGNNELYKKLVEIASKHRNAEICDECEYPTVIINGRKISVNHLVWLQLMGLYETWDII